MKFEKSRPQFRLPSQRSGEVEPISLWVGIGLAPQKTLPFARTLDNWFNIASTTKNASLVEKLYNPETYKDGHPPDLVLMGPSFVKLNTIIYATDRPTVYVSIEGRGNYEIPLEEIARTESGSTLLKIRVHFVDGHYSDIDVECPADKTKDWAKAYAEVTAALRTFGSMSGSSKVIGSEIIGEYGPSYKAYMFDGYIPFNVPTNPFEPAQFSVFALGKDGQVAFDQYKVTCLEDRLTPKLAPVAAASFMASIVSFYFENYGFIRALNELYRRLPNEPKDKLRQEFEAWYRQQGQPLTTPGLHGSGLPIDLSTIESNYYLSYLDKCILQHPAFNRSLTYNLVELVQDLNFRAASDWTHGMVDYFIETQRGIQPPVTQQEEPVTQQEKGVEPQIMTIKDAAQLYGEEWFRVVIRDSDHELPMTIVAGDGSEFPVMDSMVVDLLKESVQSNVRNEFYKFLDLYAAAVTTMHILWGWAQRTLPGYERTGVLDDVLRSEQMEDAPGPRFRLVPSFPELGPLSVPLPELMVPSLGLMGTYATYNMRAIKGLLSETVFQHWTGKLARRFGDIMTQEDYKMIHDNAKRVMGFWDDLNTANKDSRYILVDARSMLEEHFSPEMLYAFSILVDNMSGGVEYERLPYYHALLPMTWIPSRLIRYFKMAHNMRDLYKQTETIVQREAADVFVVGKTVYYVPDCFRAIMDIQTRLDAGETLDGKELAAAQKMCLDIYNSEDAKNKFNSLWLLAIYLYNTIDPENKLRTEFPSVQSTESSLLVDRVFGLEQYARRHATTSELRQAVAKELIELGMLPPPENEAHNVIVKNFDTVYNSLPRLETNGLYWVDIKAYMELCRRNPKLLMPDTQDNTSLSDEERQVVEKYVSTVKQFASEILIDLSNAGLCPYSEISVDTVHAAIDATFLPIYAALRGEEGTPTPKQLDTLRGEIDELDQSLPAVLARNLFTAYKIDGAAIAKAIEDMKPSILDLNPESPSYQQLATALKQAPGILEEIYIEFYALVSKEIIGTLTSNVWPTQHAAEQALLSAMTSCWKTACRNVLGKHDFGPDIHSMLYNLELYAQGFFIFHQGQRFVTRVLSGLLH